MKLKLRHRLRCLVISITNSKVLLWRTLSETIGLQIYFRSNDVPKRFRLRNERLPCYKNLSVVEPVH